LVFDEQEPSICYPVKSSNPNNQVSVLTPLISVSIDAFCKIKNPVIIYGHTSTVYHTYKNIKNIMKKQIDKVLFQIK
jgi:hypothetical protein